jgi:hypothetical protein
MLKAAKRSVHKAINGALGLVGCEVVRIQKKAHDWGDVGQFIPLEETLAGAREAHLSVGEYIDIKHNVPGASQDTHDRLVAMGVFKERIDRVLEIGPGSGRFLEKALRACKPSHVEIYETAREWSDYLVRSHQVVPRPTNGRTLEQTPSCSIDLVQVHKVFVCLLFLTTCSYFSEIARVTRPGAWVVFDVMTEGCMDNTNLERWLKGRNLWSVPYPAIMPKKFVLDFFQGHGFEFIGGFLVPMKPGKTEYLVFRKQSQ